MIGLFVLYSVWGPKFRRQRIADLAFIPVGVVLGFLTMFVGGTGPFVAAFISPDTFGKEPISATHGACMTVPHGFKVLMFAFLGFSFAPWMGLIAMMTVTGVLGIWAGRSVLLKLPERAFKIILIPY